MAKQYISVERTLSPRPRSKRRRETGEGGSSGNITVVQNGGGSSSAPVSGDGHTHDNKSTLDKLGTDSQGYVTTTEWVDDGQGNFVKREVRLKAGYSDLAQDLAADSPAWAAMDEKIAAQAEADEEKFLRKDVEDAASENMGFLKGLWVKAASSASKVIELLPSGLAKVKSLLVNGTWGIDDDGDATLHDVAANDVTARDAAIRDVTGRNAEFENLRVTKEAHFFRLVVDEMLSNKGAIIISSANCVVEATQEDQSTYTVYFSKTGKDGVEVNNPWVVGDHALCLTFKGEGAGTFSDVKNRYYWRKVVYVYSDITYEGKAYHAISLSKTIGEGSTEPAVGDNIVQLGYSGQTPIPARQTAIILSAYQTMDVGDSNANIRGLVPPSFAFYKGINDFALSSHRYTCMDGVANEFFGDFKVLVNNSYTSMTTLLATTNRLIAEIRNDLGTVGVDINSDDMTINLKAGKVNFLMPDGSTNAKISIDPTTGTLHAVDGVFEGTVKANNLYHGVCFLSAVGGFLNHRWYCKPQDAYGNNSWPYIKESLEYTFDFNVREYYTTEEILQISDNVIQSPAQSGFERCSGYSDIVYVLPAVNNTYPEVWLPHPADVEGKVVDVYGFYYGTPSTIPSFDVRCVFKHSQQEARMALLLEYDTGASPKLIVSSPSSYLPVTAGQLTRFVSVRAVVNNEEGCYWLKINLSEGSGGSGVTETRVIELIQSNAATRQWVNDQHFLTSFTETDPTVPNWAKELTKPSYQFSEIGGSVAASQLPTLYWANVAISNQSNNNTSPQFGELRLRPGSNNYGSHLYFGDYSYCYLQEDSDDHLKIYGRNGVEITTDSGYDLTWGGYTLATQVWVGQQGYVTSSAISDMATKTWVDSQSFVTESAFSGMLEEEAYISNGTIYIGGNSITPLTQHQSLSGCAQIGAHNNLTASSNEFTCAASGQSGTYYINYRTAGGSNGSITEYHFCDGAGNTLASISNGQFSGNAASADYAGALKDSGNTKVAATSVGATVTGVLTSTAGFTVDNPSYNISVKQSLDVIGSWPVYNIQFLDTGTATANVCTFAFNGTVESSNGFKKTGSSDDNVLLGGGGTKAVTDFIRKNINGSQGDLELGTLYLNAEEGLYLQENIGGTDYDVNIWVGSGNNSHTCHFDNSYNDFDGYKFDAGIETAGGLTINDTLVINRDNRTMKITPTNSGYFTNTVAYTLYDNSGNALNSANHCFTGNIVASGSITQSSDIRKKDVSEYLNPSVYDMAQAPIVKFRWKGDTSGREHVGTVAQYWCEVVPQIVGETPDGMLTIDYATAGVVAGVTAARKAVELERRIEEQDRRIEELEQIINQLKGN